MKSELKNNPPVEENQTYPYLGISKNGDVVIFTAPNTGARIHSPCLFPIEIGNGWVEENFEPLCGDIILSND